MDNAEQAFYANKGIIYHTMRRLGYVGPSRNRDWDEAQQVALIAGWRACLDYDPTRGALTTLMRKYVVTDLLNYRARSVRANNLCGLAMAPVTRKHEREDVLLDLYDERHTEDIEAIEDREEFEHRMRMVRCVLADNPAGSEKLRQVVGMILNGMASEEIERTAGVSHASVKAYRHAFVAHARRVLGLESEDESWEREAIIAACNEMVAEGKYPSKREVAARVGMSSATVMRRSQQLRELGVELPMMNIGEYNQFRKQQATGRQSA